MLKQILIPLFIAICSTAYAQSGSDVQITKKQNPILIGQERGFTISKAKLVSDPVLRMPEDNKDYQVKSYQLSYVSKEKESELLGPFVIKGNDMTGSIAADILNKARPGDRIFFEEIIAVSNDASKRPLKLSAAIKIQ